MMVLVYGLLVVGFVVGVWFVWWLAGERMKRNAFRRMNAAANKRVEKTHLFTTYSESPDKVSDPARLEELKQIVKDVPHTIEPKILDALENRTPINRRWYMEPNVAYPDPADDDTNRYVNRFAQIHHRLDSDETAIVWRQYRTGSNRPSRKPAWYAQTVWEGRRYRCFIGQTPDRQKALSRLSGRIAQERHVGYKRIRQTRRGTEVLMKAKVDLAQGALATPTTVEEL